MRYLVFAVAVLMGCVAPAWADDARPTLSVRGQGEVTVVPDMAVISLGVVHVADTARAAMSQVSEDARALLDVLTAAGLGARDVQTSQLRVNPVWANTSSGPRRIDGFQAQTNVTARLRDLEQVGSVLDQVLEAGGNMFSGLRFDVQDPAAAEAEARAAAVRDAMEKAEQLSAAAGVTLGPILLISEGGGVSAPRPEMFAAARAMDVPVAAGELTISATVSMTFAIAQP